MIGLQYTLSFLVQKLLFYPLCISCGKKAELRACICKNCYKELRILSLHKNFAFPYNEKTKSFLTQIRDARNQRALLLLKNWLKKHSFLQEKIQTADFILCVPSWSAQKDARMSILEYLLFESLGPSQREKLILGMLKKIKPIQQHRSSIGDRLNGKNFIGLSSSTHSLVGKKILLLDDVFTSGTSLLMAENILLKAGVASVDYFTIYRALLKKDQMLVEQHQSGKPQDSQSDWHPFSSSLE